MAWVLGLVLPVTLVAVCAAVLSWYTWLLLGLYVVVAVWSTHMQRFARAGFWPRCSPACAPVVVGGGWSWVLRRDRACAPPNRVVCPAGRVEGTHEWWYAGTTIGAVQNALACEGRTLASHPSILSATLGGWVASQSHGTGGSLWTPALGELVVEHEGTYHTLASKQQFTPGMIIHKVRLHTVDNAACERRSFVVASQHDARQLLMLSTYLRAVFVDRYRSVAFAWVPCSTDEPVTTRESFPPPWLAVILPAWARRTRAYPPRRMTLRDANRFCPIDPPLLLATPMMISRINFEVFVTYPTSSTLLWNLCQAFEALFASGKVSGRMELRFGASKQFLDFDVPRTHGDPGAVFECIRSVYGPGVAFTLHPGKEQWPTG